MAKTLEVGPYYCLPSARERERERGEGAGAENKTFSNADIRMQGRREQPTRGRRQIQRELLVRSSSGSSSGAFSERASERAEAVAAGLEEDGEEAGVCANLSYAWVSSQALVCIRMSNGLSLA